MTVPYHTQLISSAIDYLHRGFAVIPLVENSKTPRILAWPSLPFPTKEDIHQWFNASSTSNIGIRTGAVSKIFVLDVDVKKGIDSLATLTRDYGELPPTTVITTPSGGLHYYFSLDGLLGRPIRNSASRIAPGLDIRGEGGQVVAPPSAIDGEPYRGQMDSPISAAPGWLVELILSRTGLANTHHVDGTEEIVQGERDNTLISFCGVLKAGGMADEDIFLKLKRINEFRCRPPLDETDVIRIAGRAKGWAATGDSSYASLKTIPLLRNKYGIALGTSANIAIALKNDPLVSGVFRWNELFNSCYVTGTIPWEKKPVDRQLQDFDEIALKIWLSRDSGYRMTEPSLVNVSHAVQDISRANSYHPAKDFLNALSWDGTQRIDHFCSDVFGVWDLPEYHAISRILLYGFTGRVLYPGCKYDYMTVLVGRQGLGKSRFISEMFAPWAGLITAKADSEIGNQLRGKWAIEDPELNMTKKFGQYSVKSWLSDGADDYRLPYGRNYQITKKGYIIIGTTNDPDFLSDITGGRRFLPIKCNKVDFDYVAKFRDQILAESVSVVKKAVLDNGLKGLGFLWAYFPEKIREKIEQMQESARGVSYWEELITKWCKGRGEVSIRRIVVECLDIPTSHAKGNAGLIIAAILRRLGYERAIDSDGNRLWRNPNFKGYKPENASLQ